MCLILAPVAAGQLRDGGGCEPAPELLVQPLPAPLSGAEAGPRQRRLLRQADPLGVHGPTHTPAGHQVPDDDDDDDTLEQWGRGVRLRAVKRMID